MLRRALGRVAAADVDCVLFDLRPRRVVQVAIMYVVDVAIVLDRGVAAALTVLVRMVCMMLVAHPLLLVFG
jgi:hypothetical protein